MTHVKAIILLQAMLVLITASGIAIADDLQMTTYYPAPSGRYQDLTTTDMTATNTTTQDLTVSGTATLSNDLSIGNDMSVGHNLTVTNDVTVNQDLTVNGAFNPLDLNVGRDLTVAQDATIEGTTALNGVVNVTGQLRALGGVGVAGSNLIVTPFAGRPAWLNGDATNVTAAEGFNFSNNGRVGLNVVAPTTGASLSVLPASGGFATTTAPIVAIGGTGLPSVPSTLTVGGTLGVSGSAAFGGEVRAYSGVMVGASAAVCTLDSAGLMRFRCVVGGAPKCVLEVCAPSGVGMAFGEVASFAGTGGGTGADPIAVGDPIAVE